IADCGLRIGKAGVVARDLARQFRNPKSAIRNWLCVLAACTPATTRPGFAPYPEALRAVINAPPARVTAEAQTWLAAESIAVRHVSAQDAFLETAELAGTVKLRVWADPDVPGKSRVTVEAVYRPIEDPSREPRDLERPTPAGSEGQKLAERLLAALTETFGKTVY
ncbi:MAG: hypothetical protein ACREMC_11940, partial [Gemmatimonadales bacterium]